MPKFQQIALRLGVLLQQIQQGVTKRGAQRIGHISATAVAAAEQTTGGQLLDRFAHRRARHAELLRQRPFCRQTLASLQRPLQDHGLQPIDDVVGQATLLQGPRVH
ncbi:hypothetical protein SDC9_182968 [bioreactor metagenome]|uniref:Uncharacterized protein n=1 Tax=bioreactor metagenome TaxID=1076179 RepID=A0A645H9T1_9ZZZZ